MNGASLSYLTHDDIKDLPTERSKFALIKFLEKKDATDQHTFDAFLKPTLPIKNFSDLKKLPESLWFQFVGNERALALWNIALEYYKELGFKTISYRELTVLANELYPTAVKNHKAKFLRNRINNFLAGLGVYPLYDNYKNQPSKSVLFLSLAILLLAIIFLRNYRVLLILLASVHLVSVGGIAYSGVMEYRYAYITLFIFRLAVLVGIFGLAHLVWEKLVTRKGNNESAVPPNRASAPEQI